MSSTAVSPANNAAPAAERKRIPMSTPQQKLAVAEIPGYYCYWFRGTPDRLGRAIQGGYEFVTPEEAHLTNFSLGGDGTENGNTDMGTRVSIIAGEEVGADGQPVRLYLMKIKEEWHQEDVAIQAKSSETLIDVLKAGKVGSEKDIDSSDRSARYATTSGNMFTPKPLRRS